MQKKVIFQSHSDNNYLILTNGKILNINEGKTNSFDFNETQINLSKYTSKTTTFPKIQEVNSRTLYKCLFKMIKIYDNVNSVLNLFVKIKNH